MAIAAKIVAINADRFRTLGAKATGRFEAAAAIGHTSAGLLRFDSAGIGNGMDRVALCRMMPFLKPRIVDDLFLPLAAYGLHGVLSFMF